MSGILEQQFQTGIGQFNDREFFDCHDTIEELWMEASGTERRFLQGLIQIAVGYYHQGNGNFKGAASQLSKGIAKLEDCPEQCKGIDLGKLLATIRLHRTIFRSVLENTYNRNAAKELDPPRIHVLT